VHPSAPPRFAVIRADRVTKRFGGSLVLSEVSLTIGPRTRIGLVGPNGAGKTTLLRILAGLEAPDAGQVLRDPPGALVGYLPQVPDPRPGETLLAYLARRTGVAEAEARMERLRAEMGTDLSAVAAYTEALERFLALGGDDLEPRGEAVCASLGLDPARLHDPVGALSGGQAARAALAGILLARFDAFLLDEPTNDLDEEGLERLEAFLSGLTGGVGLVSHDRAFLERSVTRIAEIHPERRTLHEFAGGWSDYVRARALREEQQRRAYERFVAERDALAARARRARTDAASGAARARRRPSDPDKSLRHQKIEGAQNLASRGRTIERRMARLEAVEKPWEPWELRLDLRARRRGSDVVAQLTGAVVERGSFRLGPVDLTVSWGERLAILGPNGSGKSTLLAAITGAVPLAAGHRHVGPGVVLGEVDQSRSGFDESATVLDAFTGRAGVLHEEARSVLATFGLGATHVARPWSSLSPGEWTRVELAAVAVAGVNCLILDEPTNHLDLPAIEELERAVRRFDGTLILVSHDRRFLEALTVDRTIELASGRVTDVRLRPEPT
jgi:ATPase subunit of ABC transporter with duplicated ATPase domains